MAKDKNSPQTGSKDLSTSFKIKSVSLKERVLRLILLFLVSAFVVPAILYFLLSVLNLFPAFVPIQTANDLLNILITADGILLGLWALFSLNWFHR